MKARSLFLFSLAFLLVLPSAAPQTTSTPLAASAPTAVPSLVPYSGGAFSSDGKSLAGETGVTFQIYKEEAGGDPLWIETQTVAVDASGHYKVQFGATNSNGLPSGLFTTGEARWLEVQVSGQGPQPRVLLASVPYALKAADAATLGGLPASAFALAGAENTARAITGSPDDAPPATTVTTPGGTTGYLPAFTGSATIADSILYSTSTGIGVGDIPNSTAVFDVNGKSIWRGLLNVSRAGTATTSTGYDSYPIFLQGSVYNSSSKSAVLPAFQLQVEPTGNDTATPGATFNLLASSTGGTPAETGLHFNTNGTINFAPGQTFPATSTSGVAVDGTSTSGVGVEGGSNSNTGVLGSSNSGDGVVGISAGGANAAGVYGTVGTKSGSLAGVYGIGGAASGLSYPIVPGVWGDSSTQVGVLGTTATANSAGVAGDSTSGIGVQGISDTAFGVQGDSGSSVGVYGNSSLPANGTAGILGGTGDGSNMYSTQAPFQVAGVWGDSSGNPNSGDYAAGVIGTADNADGGSFFNNSRAYATVYAHNLGGGYGLSGLSAGYSNGSNGTAGVGISGVLVGPSKEGGIVYDTAGIWADTSVTEAAALLATADEGGAGVFYNNGSDYITIYAENDAASSSSAPVLETFGGNFFGTCTINVSGDLTCNGSVGVVESVDNDARKVETYAMQSSENWLEDFGSGQLSEGEARIDLDPTYAQTVNSAVAYHVFLTPKGDCKGLYVTNETAAGFEVREMGGGKSAVAFDYRIVAKRAGYENVRLADVTEQFKRQAEQREKMKHTGAAKPLVRLIAPSRPVQPGAGSPVLHRPVPLLQPAVKTPPGKVAELR